MTDGHEDEAQRARAGFLTRWGKPVQAPATLDDAYREPSATRAMEALFQGLGGELIAIDCTHYPCLAEGLSPVFVADEYLPGEYPFAYRANATVDPVAGPGWFQITIALPASDLDDLEKRFVYRRMLRQHVESFDAIRSAVAEPDEGAP